jgi:hypothetical protein
MSTTEMKQWRSVFLVAVGDEAPNVEELIDEYCDEFFEHCLAEWCTDDALWPVNRTPHVFRDWLQVESVDSVWDADPLEPLLVSERALTHCAGCDQPLEDEVVFVGIGEKKSRRLTADEVERLDEQAEDDARRAADVAVILRCCSEECAAGLEEEYERAIALAADRAMPRRPPLPS